MYVSMMSAPRTVEACKNMLGEGPLWCAREQALWWIDAHQPSLWRWQPESDRAQSWSLPKPPGCLALLEDGGLLIAFRSRFAVMPRAGAELRWVDVPLTWLGDERFNDGKVDRRGRFWVGTIDRSLSRPIGRLYCMDDLQGFRRVDQGFVLSNGIGWSPDDSTLYFSETHSRSIYRYDFEVGRGQASNRRVFVQLPDGTGGPDGLTVDADGGVWSAHFGRGCIKRYLPDGDLDRTIELPVSCPTSCTFGGPEMRTLFVTTARLGLSEAQLAAEPSAGALIAVDVPETGIVEPRLVLN